MMRGETEHSKIPKGKLVLLGMGVVLLAGFMVVTQMKYSKQHPKDVENTERLKDTELVNTQADMTQEDNLLSEVVEQKKTIQLTNIYDYISSYAIGIEALLEEGLTNYAAQEGITVSEATVFHVAIPPTDIDSVCYFVSLGGEPEVLCVLSYHSRENVVTASNVTYSKEEIINEVWQNNEPAVRDVSPEVDAGGTQETGAAEDGTVPEGTVPEDTTPEETAPVVEETIGGTL